MNKIRLLTVLLLLPLNFIPAQEPVRSAHYDSRLQVFEQETPICHQEIVMLGNSLTQNGGDWNTRLGKKLIRNRGIIGDDAQGIYDRLDEITSGHPRKIFLLAGVNDLSHDLTVDSIVAQLAKVIDKIRKDSPQTRLYVQSLLPINESFNRYQRLNGKSDSIPVINRKLKKVAKSRKARFINLFPRFTAHDARSLRPELTTDGLHLNESGYVIWCKALKKRI